MTLISEAMSIVSKYAHKRCVDTVVAEACYLIEGLLQNMGKFPTLEDNDPPSVVMRSMVQDLLNKHIINNNITDGVIVFDKTITTAQMYEQNILALVLKIQPLKHGETFHVNLFCTPEGLCWRGKDEKIYFYADHKFVSLNWEGES